MAKPYTLKMKIKHAMVRVIMLAFSIFPINRKKVVVCNYFGKGYGDNGKAITEALLKKDESLDIVWGVKPDFEHTLPKCVRSVPYNSLKYLYELSTAGAWVDNSRKNAGIRKRKKQFYVQTWHGTTALKRIEADVKENLDEFYVAGAKNDSKMADVILSGCRFFTELCKRAFWFGGEILECGSPRSDALFKTDEKRQCEVKKALGLANDVKIILYAPTFRAAENTDCYSIEFENVLNELKKKTCNDYAFAVRLHPNVSEKADFIKYSKNIVNATNYADLYELIASAEIVISDYSSLIFDSALIDKKVFLFATDIDEYSQDRNFYFDFEKLPFKLARNNSELINNILSFNEAEYKASIDAFNSEIGYFENGTASEKVAERILKELNEKQ